MATAKNPTDRFGTAVELHDALTTPDGISDTTIHMPITHRATDDIAIKTPNTVTGRNRLAMLKNIRHTWIEGVLEGALHHTLQLTLGMKTQSGAVNSPWDILVRTRSGSERILDHSIIEVFDRLNGKLLILGEPGSGKTITLLTLARCLLERAETDMVHPIPIVLNLSSWTEACLALDVWIVEELKRIYQVPRRVSRAWLQDDQVLLLLDGLDEVDIKNRASCVASINAYREDNGFVDIVVCSRTKDYEALTHQLVLNGAIVIQPLSRAQIEAYLRDLGTDFEPIVALLHDDPALLELCQSPLMLSVIALTYGSDDVALPIENDAEALRNAIFDAYVKQSFRRNESNTPYTMAYTYQQLSWLARTMQTHSQSIFEIENLQPTWLGEQGLREFIWVHRTVVVVIGCVVWGGAHLMSQVAGGMPLWNAPLSTLAFMTSGALYAFLMTGRRYAHWLNGVVIAAIMSVAFVGRGSTPFEGILFGVIFGLIYLVFATVLQRQGYHPHAVRPIEKVRFSRTNVKLLPAVFTGIIVGIGIVNAQQPIMHPTRLPLALIAAVVPLTIVIMVLTGLTRNTVGTGLHPNQGIKYSFRNGLRIALTYTVFIFVAIFTAQFLLNGFSQAATEAVGTSLYQFWVVAFVFGLAPAIQHIVLRALLRRNLGLPWNYAAFLDYASRLILVRRLGGSYIFIHRYLLEYFAARHESEPARRGKKPRLWEILP